jgi:hypothetical protein
MGPATIDATINSKLLATKKRLTAGGTMPLCAHVRLESRSALSLPANNIYRHCARGTLGQRHTRCAFNERLQKLRFRKDRRIQSSAPIYAS